MSARYSFAAHPEALADLRDVPEKIRDLALLELEHLVHGHERGAALRRELAGCHKIYVDPQTRWRMVIQYRDAPASSQHKREIYLLSVGERHENAAYSAAARRLQREHQRMAGTPHAHRAHAARARSTHTRYRPGEPAASAPGTTAPQQHPRRTR
ncbi:type II toxin-antitoxin system RelE family toxin [Streptomyces sp. NRRL F-5053]|uniref:type II toxin-antitoxin system RelE family toxin n=1 Tax=Streptomyces sp. NRRL F-5053 TaxID=1463854 RepID=UPI0004C59920|nr:hypothetical protein [Streptomyces sp. NRRL F-5053]